MVQNAIKKRNEFEEKKKREFFIGRYRTNNCRYNNNRISRVTPSNEIQAEKGKVPNDGTPPKTTGTDLTVNSALKLSSLVQYPKTTSHH